MSFGSLSLFFCFSLSGDALCANTVLFRIPNGLGQGVHYWEPAWVNSTALGSKCQDVILFDTDWSEYPAVTAYSRRSVDMFKDV